MMWLANRKTKLTPLSVMENLPESDARMLPGFGPGQGIISGQAVRFPLLVKIQFDEDLVGSRTGDENFIRQAAAWKPDAKAAGRAQVAETAARLAAKVARRKGSVTGD